MSCFTIVLIQLNSSFTFSATQQIFDAWNERRTVIIDKNSEISSFIGMTTVKKNIFYFKPSFKVQFLPISRTLLTGDFHYHNNLSHDFGIFSLSNSFNNIFLCRDTQFNFFKWLSFKKNVSLCTENSNCNISTFTWMILLCKTFLNHFLSNLKRKNKFALARDLQFL